MSPSRLGMVKMWLGLSGLVVGVIGMALQQRPVVLAAVALLGAAVVVRLVERKRAAAAE